MLEVNGVLLRLVDSEFRESVTAVSAMQRWTHVANFVCVVRLVRGVCAGRVEEEGAFVCSCLGLVAGVRKEKDRWECRRKTILVLIGSIRVCVRIVMSI